VALISAETRCWLKVGDEPVHPALIGLLVVAAVAVATVHIARRWR